MSGKDIDDMTFEKFKFWTVSSLKDLLGEETCKEMLIARSFAAFEMKIGRSNDILKYTCRGIVYGSRHSLQQNTSEQ